MYTSRDQLGRTSVTFTVDPAVGARSVSVCGEWNDWSPSADVMQRDAVGGFSLTVTLRSGRPYRFRYLIDGVRWENDWYADRYEPNEFGGEDSVVDLTPIASARAHRIDVAFPDRPPVADGPVPVPAPAALATTAPHLGTLDGTGDWTLGPGAPRAPAPPTPPPGPPPLIMAARRRRLERPSVLAWIGAAAVAAAVTAVALTVSNGQGRPTSATHSVGTAAAAAYAPVAAAVSSAVATEQAQVAWVTAQGGLPTAAQVLAFTVPVVETLDRCAGQVAALAIPAQARVDRDRVVADLDALAYDYHVLADDYPGPSAPGDAARVDAALGAWNQDSAALSGALTS